MARIMSAAGAEHAAASVAIEEMPVSVESRSCQTTNRPALANNFNIKIEHCCPSMEILLLDIFLAA